MERQFYAHSLEGEPEEQWQPLDVHLLNVAQMARRFGKLFSAGRWAYLAGLWHDLGKYGLSFQRRIGVELDPDANIETRSGRPDHSTAGAQHAVKELKDPGKLLAYAIAGHHAGLPDGSSTENSCLSRRLKKNVEDISGVSFPKSDLKLTAKDLPFTPDQKRAGFQLSFFVRMLYSCLVDADFLDTEAFMNPEKPAWRKGYPELSTLHAKLSDHLEILKEKATDTPINRQRDEILQQCLDAASLRQGLFSLTVPTGGGKTLSSLAFALKHALAHGLERIIYVIPYTSIIEQNAAVFREVLGEEAVLEHHSNFDATEEREDRRSRMAAENWDAPLVVTTNVQFFESLFHNRSSKCRKLHNIARSVVILDEAQMLPAPLLLPCIEALREISSIYGTSLVLCTATQPAIAKTPLFQWGLDDVHEIVSDPQQLYTAFKRVETVWLGELSDDRIAEELGRHEQVLCVVNTRKHARILYEKMAEEEGRYHLSGLMCPAHRTERFKKIRQMLEDGLPCRLISTQLIEAGVDIDFPAVFRSAAGIDSIAQAAGRCNREGKMAQPGRVHVFMPEDGLPPGDFRQHAQTAAAIMRHHADMLSLPAIRAYFEALYWQKGIEGLDRERILELLQEDLRKGNFPFREIAERFRLIHSPMQPLIIPWDQLAEGLVQQLRYVEHPGPLIRKLQRYTIQIPPPVLTSLVAAGSVERTDQQGQFPVLINMDLYREDLGLCPEDPTFHAVQSLIL